MRRRAPIISASSQCDLDLRCRLAMTLDEHSSEQSHRSHGSVPCRPPDARTDQIVSSSRDGPGTRGHPEAPKSGARCGLRRIQRADCADAGRERAEYFDAHSGVARPAYRDPWASHSNSHSRGNKTELIALMAGDTPFFCERVRVGESARRVRRVYRGSVGPHR